MSCLLGEMLGGACILSRLLKLLLYILMKHISPEQGQHVQVLNYCPETCWALLMHSVILFKVSEMFKVVSEQSGMEELTSVTSHATKNVSQCDSFCDDAGLFFAFGLY